jgi:hypothetical protein
MSKDELIWQLSIALSDAREVITSEFVDFSGPMQRWNRCIMLRQPQFKIESWCVRIPPEPPCRGPAALNAKNRDVCIVQPPMRNRASTISSMVPRLSVEFLALMFDQHSNNP